MKESTPLGKERQRLMRVLQQDRLHMSTENMAMLRSDVAHLLEDYFDLDTDSMQVNLEAREDGAYILRIAAKAVRIKT